MFYRDTHGDQLRFGDVVTGFPSAHAFVEQPAGEETEGTEVVVRLSNNLAVVLTPCCEVGKSEYLTLVPLLSISHWSYPLKNQYFRVDPLRLNVRTDPANCVPVDQWEAMKPEERRERSAKGPVYAFNYLFAYPNKPPILVNDTFSVDFGQGRVDHTAVVHVMDFRDAFRVSIVKEKHKEFGERKKLELTAPSRELLRLKLAQFYGQTPKEDAELISAEAASPTESSDTPAR
jgi:hypothetical protein